MIAEYRRMLWSEWKDYSENLSFEEFLISELVKARCQLQICDNTAVNREPPHPDCYVFGGRGCQNVRLDPRPNKPK